MTAYSRCHRITVNARWQSTHADSLENKPGEQRKKAMPESKNPREEMRN